MSGIWKILKYYEPVLLPNTTYRSCYYLFIIEAEKFSGVVSKTRNGVTRNRVTGFFPIFFFFLLLFLNLFVRLPFLCFLSFSQ